MEVAVGYTILSVLAISFVSLIGIAALAIRTDLFKVSMHFFIGLAAGALLGNSFIYLIPEAFENGIGGIPFAIAILSGIVTFLLLEKYLHFHNKNAEHSECTDGEHCVVKKKKPVGLLILLSDGVHNFIDGAIIAASYMISIPLGITTTISVILHEVPQEVNDFALLLHSGYSKTEALIWNFVSALTALLGVALFFALGDTFQNIAPLATTFAAGGFIYIAAANLVPEIQKTEHPGRSAVEFLAVLLGIGIMFALLLI